MIVGQDHSFLGVTEHVEIHRVDISRRFCRHYNIMAMTSACLLSSLIYTGKDEDRQGVRVAGTSVGNQASAGKGCGACLNRRNRRTC